MALGEYGKHTCTVNGVKYTFTTIANQAGDPELAGVLTSDEGGVISEIHYSITDNLMKVWGFGVVEALRYLNRFAFVHARIRLEEGEMSKESVYLFDDRYAESTPDEVMQKMERQRAGYLGRK